MVIIFPPPITRFLNILEIPDKSQIDINLYESQKTEFLKFIEDITNQIIEDWELAKTTLPLSNKILLTIEKDIPKIQQIKQNIFQQIINQKIEELNDKKLEEIIQNIVKLINYNNKVGIILSNQKLLSPYPVIDRFLKIFWTYIENIKNLENFPLNLLIKYLFGSFKLIQDLEKKLKIEKNVFHFSKEIIHTISEQENFIEAKKYALGACYNLINGELNLAENPELPSKIFIQINQSSNGFFLLEKEKMSKINKEIFKNLLAKIKDYSEEEKTYILSSLKNNIYTTILNPNFINNIPLNIEKITEIIHNLNDFEIGLIQINEIEDYILNNVEYLITLSYTQLKNEENKNIRELLNAFSLFLTDNIPLSIFLNILLNVKNFLKISAIIIYNEPKISEVFKELEELIKESINYGIYKDNIATIYLVFHNFIKLFKLIFLEINELVEKKIICPACKVENEFFAEKCINCNFQFPVLIEKLLIRTIQKAPLIIQTYCLSIIENYIINKDIQKTINEINKTISKLEESIQNILENEEIQEKIYDIIESLKNIIYSIENESNEQTVLEDILNFLEKTENIRDLFDYSKE